jgi:hypothetical protein
MHSIRDVRDLGKEGNAAYPGQLYAGKECSIRGYDE